VRRERVFDVGAERFCDEPIDFVRGEEVHLYDADGRRYLDLYNNVPCAGHCRPHADAFLATFEETLRGLH
jgi:4-aminobutyrate aminotransferase-like enzyme